MEHTVVMSSALVQSLVPAALTGWLGYVLAGRRWRQGERRTVYKEYLFAAHEALDALFEFERRWDQDPANMPRELYDSLVDKNRRLERASQDVRLIAPWKVSNAASISGSIDSLLTEIVYIEESDDYENRQPPSYEWLHSRRHVYLWGPDGNDVDEFVNLARADLGAQSRFWRLRGDFVSYRKGLPAWIKWTALPRLPLIGSRWSRRLQRQYEETARRSDEHWKSTQEQRREQHRALARSSNQEAEEDGHGSAHPSVES
jgi:hypothetical protein